MMQPPRATKKSYSYSLHNDMHEDPYAWLRYRDQYPDVLHYLEAENAYTHAYMQDTEALQKSLFDEMCARMQLTDVSVPYYEKGYFYYWRALEAAEYPQFCRHAKEATANEVILLDENELAKEHPYYHMGACKMSPNQRCLAYTEDTCGNEEYTLFIKYLNDNTTVDTELTLISAHIAWANDNRTIFYVKLDETWRPYQVWAYDIVTQATRLCYTEIDPAFWVSIQRSKTGRFMLLDTASKITSETHFLEADHPQDTFICLYPRQENVKYEVFPHEDAWYILTNLDAKNYRLVRAPFSNPAQDNWDTLLAHRPEVKLADLEIFKNFLVISEHADANVQLRVIGLADTHDFVLAFAENAYRVSPTDNIDFYTDTLRIAYTSLTTPVSVYDIHLVTQQRELLKQTAVLGDFAMSDYVSERVYAVAADGTRIPISLVYHRNTPRDGSAPLYLYGYGAYGVSLHPGFSHARLSLLNRGIMFAIAHVRGGGDNGEYWYEAGKLRQKKHTFTDFIACAQHLINAHYTLPNKLVISGGSAGGLLVGAVLNQRPDLFAIAIADVPFVDVVNTMSDPTIPLTTAEYVEWGNPANPDDYQYIKSYSPYDNISAQHYPALLVTAGLSDPRVAYWEPAKWVAKLREYKTDQRPLLLKTNMTAGHGGASGRFAALKEVAFEYAFVLKELKMATHE